MTLQEIQNQALQLPIGDRWQLVQVLLDSLKQEANPNPKEGTCRVYGVLLRFRQLQRRVTPKWTT